MGPALETAVRRPDVFGFVLRRNEPDELQKVTGPRPASLFQVVFEHAVVQSPCIVSRGALDSSFASLNLK